MSFGVAVLLILIIRKVTNLGGVKSNSNEIVI